MTKTLTVKRAIYGKKETPVDQREYKSEFSSAVGTCNDWKKFALQNGYGKVVFVELDGSTWEQFVFVDDSAKDDGSKELEAIAKKQIDGLDKISKVLESYEAGRGVAVDISAELEKDNVVYEKNNRSNIKISVIKEKKITLKSIEAKLDVLRARAEKTGYSLVDEADRQAWKELRDQQEAIKDERKRRQAEKASGNKEFQAIYDEARKAGLLAGQGSTPNPIIVSEVGLDDKPYNGSQSWLINEGACGFAWIDIPSREAFGKWIVAIGYGDRETYKHCVEIWVGEFNQSVARKEAYAEAFAKVLQKYGITAYAGSRLD